MRGRTITILIGVVVIAAVVGFSVARLFGSNVTEGVTYTPPIYTPVVEAESTLAPAPTGAPAASSAATAAPEATTEAATAEAATAAPEATAEATAAPARTIAPTSAATAAPEATAVAEATAEATAAPEATAEATAEAAYIEYTIKRGDILARIAKNYGVTVEEILAINSITNANNLTVGQVIRIPR